MKTRRLLAIIISVLMLTAFTTVTAFASEEDTFDPDGTYRAFLQVQASNWTFRDNWDHANFGEHGSDWESNGGNREGSFFGLFTTDRDDPGVRDGVFTDVVLEGNGTYRVSLTDFDFGNAESFNILGVSTDVPAAGNPLTFSNVKVMMGGRTIFNFDDEGEEPVVNHDNAEFYIMQVINQWNDELPEIGYMMPTDGEIAIEFTVDGFNYDKAGSDTGAAGAEGTAGAPGEAGAAGEGAEGDEDGDGFPLWLIIAIAGAAVVLIVVIALVAKKKK